MLLGGARHGMDWFLFIFINMTKEKKKRVLQEAKKIIDALAEQNIVVKPQDLVDKARAKRSPLHGYFVWDDNDAGEMYRKHQAGQLIARVKVVYRGDTERAYQKVRVKVKYQAVEKEEEGYVTTARVLSEEDLRNQVVKKGLGDLRRWKYKYSVYEELMELVNSGKMAKLKQVLV